VGSLPGPADPRYTERYGSARAADHSNTLDCGSGICGQGGGDACQQSCSGIAVARVYRCQPALRVPQPD
jgi:hypothetical protein